MNFSWSALLSSGGVLSFSLGLCQSVGVFTSKTWDPLARFDARLIGRNGKRLDITAYSISFQARSESTSPRPSSGQWVWTANMFACESEMVQLTGALELAAGHLNRVARPAECRTPPSRGQQSICHNRRISPSAESSSPILQAVTCNGGLHLEWCGPGFLLPGSLLRTSR